MLLITNDPDTAGTVACNLDYSRFCLLVAHKIRDLLRFLEPNGAGIVMPDIQTPGVDDFWRVFKQSSARLPVILITTREVKLDPDVYGQVDEILYKPLDFLEMNKRLAALANMIELEQRLPEEQRPLPEEGKPKILLVEDSAVQRNILTRQLTEHGFEVLGAADGEEAFALARTAGPDLILLDLMLPKVDGLEVCRRLKASSRTVAVPVVFLTSSRRPEEKIKALECGAHDFLTKPVMQQELLIRIRFLLRQKQLLDNLAEQASQDPLTGLGNRRQLMRDLRLEMERAKRYGTPLSLILLDVDQFKKYNDTYGHLAGDEVLRQLARLLTQNVRAFDRVARYGGEEFVVLLPQTDLAGAVAAAEKLRRAVEEHPFRGGEARGGEKLTISLGVTCFPGIACAAAAGVGSGPGVAAGSGSGAANLTATAGLATAAAAISAATAATAVTTDDLLQQADQAMYRAKAAGRNRVAVASSGGAQTGPAAAAGPGVGGPAAAGPGAGGGREISCAPAWPVL